VGSPEEARDLVLTELLDGDTTGKRLMVHPELLHAGTAIPTWHGTALSVPADGFVVFVDDFALANFEHPCRYVFVDHATGVLQVTAARTPPSGMGEWLEMETEAYLALMRATNVRPPRLREKSPPRTTPRGGEYYAVLMNGGYNKSNNHVRYWNDLSNIYITLVDVYGYKDENIFVLCSDGLDPTPDQSNNQNSDPDLDGDGDNDIMYSCIYSNIQLVFSQLQSMLTVDDQLFVFTTDHGSSNGGWSTYLNLWNMQSLTDDQLESMVDALPQCDMTFTMEQCYSGGFEDDLTVLPGRVFSSACAYNELSWAMPPDYLYDTYVFFWTAAVKGEDAYGVPCNADLNGDNLVSMHEAFLYAEAHDFSAETPQYGSNPADLGDNLFLGPGPILVLKFPDGLPEGNVAPGPEHAITLSIEAGLENYVPGTGLLHYRFDPAGSYTQAAVTPLGGDLYEVTLPGTVPGDLPEFYFSAQGDGGTTVCSPFDAPNEVYSFDVAIVITLFQDDFETDLGWTVENINLLDGPWERGIPAGGGGRGDPPTDHDGSGNCYLTDNVAGNSDVDGGPTRLISPEFDLSQGDARISYHRWHYNDDNNDIFTVDVSNNGGATWVIAEQVGHTSGWIEAGFNVADLLAPNETITVRFSAKDDPNDSVTEAGLDAFFIERIHAFPSLWAGSYEINVSTGCRIPLHLDAGAGFAGREYIVAGSLSGSQPGFKLPGGRVLPINNDWLTGFILSHINGSQFQDFQGYLDGQGQAVAHLDLGPLSPLYVGETATLAFTLTQTYDFVSNPIDIEIVP